MIERVRHGNAPYHAGEERRAHVELARESQSMPVAQSRSPQFWPLLIAGTIRFSVAGGGELRTATKDVNVPMGNCL